MGVQLRVREGNRLRAWGEGRAAAGPGGERETNFRVDGRALFVSLWKEA